MNVFSLIVSILFVVIFILLYFKKHIYKLKNYNYHIGSSYKQKKTVYYITYQPKHGIYTHTKKLKSYYSYFVSPEIIDLLVATFDNPDNAETALETLNEKLKHLS